MTWQSLFSIYWPCYSTMTTNCMHPGALPILIYTFYADICYKHYPLPSQQQRQRPPRRRKRCHIESEATETATRKKVYRRSSTIAQAQTCTTRGSSVSRSSPDDTESIGADYQEYPLQGFLKCMRIGRETTYNLEFRLLDLPDSLRPSIGLDISNPMSSRESVVGSAHSQVCVSHAKRLWPGLQKQRKCGRLQYTAEEDNLLMCLKKKGLL